MCTCVSGVFLPGGGGGEEQYIRPLIRTKDSSQWVDACRFAALLNGSLQTHTRSYERTRASALKHRYTSKLISACVSVCARARTKSQTHTCTYNHMYTHTRAHTHMTFVQALTTI